MKLPEPDAAHLWDMLDAAQQAQAFCHDKTLEQLVDDVRTRYAVERALEIIGEAARRVSTQTRYQNRKIPWEGIIGFRNVLAHEYGAIDYTRMYTVIEHGIPDLIQQLKILLKS